MQGMSEVIHRNTRKTIGYGTWKRINTSKVQKSLKVARLINAVSYQLFKPEVIYHNGIYPNLKTATTEIAMLAEDNYFKFRYTFLQFQLHTTQSVNIC